MKLPIGSTVGGMTIFNEANHNNVDNPHNQYNIPVYTTSPSGTNTDKYTLIFKYTVVNQGHVYANADIFSNTEDYRRLTGSIIIDGYVYFDNTINLQLRFNNRNPYYRFYNSTLIGFVEPDGNGNFTISVYLHLALQYEIIKIVPVVNYISKKAAWTAYNFDYVRRDINPWLSNQALDLLTTVQNRHNTSITYYGDSLNEVLRLTSLPTANPAYEGKFILLQKDSGQANEMYVCLKMANDSYNWFKLNVT